jgi:hypothetical protein
MHEFVLLPKPSKKILAKSRSVTRTTPLARLNFGLGNAVILREYSFTLGLAPVISRQEYVERVRTINEISRKHRSFRIAFRS